MFTLPDLSYSFDALEPHIDAATMELHHDKHHATYIKNLNDALEGKEELLSKDIDELISNLDQVPEEIRTKVRNNGGGHANHSFFWQILSPESKEPDGSLLELINNSFGSFEAMKEQFNKTGLARFGSGWVWVIKTPEGKLEIIDTPNQDSPLMDKKGTPILALDVWEHAYYLKYQNRRAEYIEAFWKIINWDKVSSLV